MRSAIPMLLVLLLGCGDDAAPAGDGGSGAGDAAIPGDAASLDDSGTPVSDGGADGAATRECNDPLTGRPISPDDLRDGTPDGSVSFHLVRCPVAQGAGFSQIYRVDLFELTWGGETYGTSHPGQLTYENTHHNWNDSLIARLPDRTLRWRVEYRGGDVNRYYYFVSAETPEGDPLLAETEIEGPTL